MSKGTKRLVILLFIATVALAIGAIFVSFRLENQEDILPDTSDAAGFGVNQVIGPWCDDGDIYPDIPIVNFTSNTGDCYVPSNDNVTAAIADGFAISECTGQQFGEIHVCDRDQTGRCLVPNPETFNEGEIRNCIDIANETCGYVQLDIKCPDNNRDMSAITCYPNISCTPGETDGGSNDGGDGGNPPECGTPCTGEIPGECGSLICAAETDPEIGRVCWGNQCEGSTDGGDSGDDGPPLTEFNIGGEVICKDDGRALENITVNFGNLSTNSVVTNSAGVFSANNVMTTGAGYSIRLNSGQGATVDYNGPFIEQVDEDNAESLSGCGSQTNSEPVATLADGSIQYQGCIHQEGNQEFNFYFTNCLEPETAETPIPVSGRVYCQDDGGPLYPMSNVNIYAHDIFLNDCQAGTTCSWDLVTNSEGIFNVSPDYKSGTNGIDVRVSELPSNGELSNGQSYLNLIPQVGNVSSGANFAVNCNNDNLTGCFAGNEPDRLQICQNKSFRSGSATDGSGSYAFCGFPDQNQVIQNIDFRFTNCEPDSPVTVTPTPTDEPVPSVFPTFTPTPTSTVTPVPTSPPSNPNECGVACSSTSDCVTGNTCDNGICKLTACVNGSSVCDSSNCGFIECGDPCGVGGACPTGMECSTNNICILDDCINGECTNECILPQTDFNPSDLPIFVIAALVIMLGVVYYRVDGNRYLLNTKLGKIFESKFNKYSVRIRNRVSPKSFEKGTLDEFKENER